MPARIGPWPGIPFTTRLVALVSNPMKSHRTLNFS